MRVLVSACVCACGCGAWAGVRMHMCLCVRERVCAREGAHACALEAAGSRMCGLSCVRICMYQNDLPYLTISNMIEPS